MRPHAKTMSVPAQPEVAYGYLHFMCTRACVIKEVHTWQYASSTAFLILSKDPVPTRYQEEPQHTVKGSRYTHMELLNTCCCHETWWSFNIQAAEKASI